MTTTLSTDLGPSLVVVVDAVRAGLPGMRVCGKLGIVNINSSLPVEKYAGETVTVPMVANLGRMAEYAEGDPITVDKLTSTGENETVVRAGKAFAITALARQLRGNIDPVGTARAMMLDSVGDYVERKSITSLTALGTTYPAIKRSVHSATTPKYFDLDTAVYARSVFGDELRGIRGTVMHSQALNRCLLQKDADGRLLHPVLSRDDDNAVVTFSDLGPCYASDLMPVSYTVTSTGTTPPVLTITGSPKQIMDEVQVQCTTLGAFGTAVIKISTDGGTTWTLTGITVPVSGIVDRSDDLGLTLTFAAGTFAVNNLYKTRAKYTSMIAKANAAIFWHNNFGQIQSLPDVLRSSETTALELLCVVHAYSKMNMGTRPGVGLVDHN